MTGGELNLLRRRCRRGILEPDLLLERFPEKYGSRFEGKTFDSFRTRPTCADDDLLDPIRGRGNAATRGLPKWCDACVIGESAPILDVEPVI